jgi:hypothetical protein
MRSCVHRLGSIKVAVALLLVVLVALAAGTIIESMRGSDAAARLVYDALWFRLLLGAYALNLLFSLADLFPWGTQRIGFVLTHGSMLVILCGAMTTLLFKTEGDMALWEGDTGASFKEAGRNGVPERARDFALPFSVRLDAFEIRRGRLAHVGQSLFQHRRRMRVAGHDGDLPAAKLELVRKLLQDRLHESVAHLAVIQRYKHEPLP